MMNIREIEKFNKRCLKCKEAKKIYDVPVSPTIGKQIVIYILAWLPPTLLALAVAYKLGFASDWILSYILALIGLYGLMLIQHYYHVVNRASSSTYWFDSDKILEKARREGVSLKKGIILLAIGLLVCIVRYASILYGLIGLALAYAYTKKKTHLHEIAGAGYTLEFLTFLYILTNKLVYPLWVYSLSVALFFVYTCLIWLYRCITGDFNFIPISKRGMNKMFIYFFMAIVSIAITVVLI